jgi:hypothetical protein
LQDEVDACKQEMIQINSEIEKEANKIKSALDLYDTVNNYHIIYVNQVFQKYTFLCAKNKGKSILKNLIETRL